MLEIDAQATACYEQFVDFTNRGYNIVYVDEVMFTRRTMFTHCYSPKNEPFEYDFSQCDNRTVAVIAAISYFRGVEMVSVHPRSVNVRKFLAFLDDLRSQHFADDIAIFMDRLSVHRSRLVQQRMQELSIGCIFNASYSPNNNPIENVFGVSK